MLGFSLWTSMACQRISRWKPRVPPKRIGKTIWKQQQNVEIQKYTEYAQAKQWLRSSRTMAGFYRFGLVEEPGAALWKMRCCSAGGERERRNSWQRRANLQYDAMWCNMMQCDAMWCNVLLFWKTCLRQDEANILIEMYWNVFFDISCCLHRCLVMPRATPTAVEAWRFAGDPWHEGHERWQGASWGRAQ